MMKSLRTLALLSLFAVFPAVQTQAFLLDFSNLPDGTAAANTAVPGIADLETTRSSNNQVGAYGEFGGGRGIELQPTGSADGEFILNPFGSETLVPSNNWLGFRFQVDITDGVATLGHIREHKGHGGDDFTRILINSDGTWNSGLNNTVALGTYNADQWYHIAYDNNFGAGTSDIYVDGVNKGTVTHDSVQPDANSIAFFAFKGENRGAPQIQVDYIVTGSSLADVTVPEPSSLALLGLAGLMMVRRRRA